MQRFLAALVFVICSLLTASASAQDVPECRDPAYLPHFWLSAPAGASCEQVASDSLRWNGHTRRIRLIHLRGSAYGDRGAYASGLNEVAEAASRAMARLGGGADIDNVTIFLGDTISPEMGIGAGRREPGTIGAYALPPFGDECPIYYFKTNLGRDRNQAIDMLVHELFHCIQYKRWGGSMRGENWLIEGSAEYFVYLARPTRGPDDIQSFDSAIASQALSSMTYQAVPFFLWLGHSAGPPQVLQFITRPEPIAAMVPFDMWESFGRAYFDERIHMPDGTPMPSHPVVPSGTVNASARLHFGSAPAYTLAARDLVFAQPKIYHLAVPPAAANFFFLWRTSDSADWGTAPSDVTTHCADKRYRAIWGGTGGDEAVDATVRARSGAPGACSCPAGVWQETQESIRHYFEQSLTGGGPGRRYVSGTRVLTLNSDHTGSLSYNAIELISGEGTDLVLDQVQTGTSNFTWKVRHGMILAALRRGSGLVMLHNTMTVRGHVTHDTREFGMQTIGHTYSCDSSGLHLTVAPHKPIYRLPGMTKGFSANMDFQRISSGGPP